MKSPPTTPNPPNPQRPLFKNYRLFFRKLFYILYLKML
ncbi:hypothetical protein HPHPH4_0260 [Helicobacter pylori Hp H-4]|uniref:Uncharacterized protein n=1 Tax=Helicobacter pylori Hp P-2 TaxID=992073 RepID=I9W686_HELPX|nr:hypothetical protein HPHPH4_0260 [Helicobacter pylori Hp H-4]EJB99539.1 hypothetical protein HPHPP2_0246 [Helicobacter pylori Hp P-2]EJC57470.1 hypothetical protein HPHPP2B_0249 [Helicobacter pylori Hp P-2b]